VIKIKHKAFDKLHQSGFSLVELVIIIVTLGILAVVAIPMFGDMVESSKISATQSEMENIKRAIVGNPRVVAGGELVDRGFEGDNGFPPSQLADLVIRPGSLAVYDKITRLGWNGPYIDGSNNDYLTDSWGTAYIYNSASRTIQSVGGSDTLTVTF
jgi:type II secretory pathway pseudopilin PulG